MKIGSEPALQFDHEVFEHFQQREVREELGKVPDDAEILEAMEQMQESAAGVGEVSIGMLTCSLSFSLPTAVVSSAKARHDDGQPSLKPLRSLFFSDFVFVIFTSYTVSSWMVLTTRTRLFGSPCFRSTCHASSLEKFGYA